MEIAGNALVVGGGSGIGRSSAVLLAKEGASGIMIGDLNLDAAAETVTECQAVATHPHFQAKAVLVDVTNEDSVRNLFREAVSEFGRVDFCVNCAGIGAQEATDIAGLSLAEFQRFLDINSTGTFLVTREASITMRMQELRPLSNASRGSIRGAIVNLGSATSLVASPGVLPYTASKHAALGLTKNSGKSHSNFNQNTKRCIMHKLTSLVISALDNASYGIRVNCVCPSWTDTPMVRRAIEGVEGLAEFINKAVPLGRIAVPEEVADVVVFLCSPRSSYMTGCALIVDGGTTLTALR